MPELPEVETTRAGIAPLVTGQTINRICIRQAQLRWPIPRSLAGNTEGQKIIAVQRRGKYLLIQLAQGSIIIHLGMSGSLRVIPSDTAVQAHDHFDIELDNHQTLRLHDPRRFGSVLWQRGDPLKHKLLRALGPEPLSDEFNGAALHARARNRKINVKAFIMDSHNVVGVGNIYASESLFNAGIHPKRAAGRISLPRYIKLAEAIKCVLQQAIEQGGTTLRDFSNADGKPGYFKQRLKVYDRAGEACVCCGEAIKQITLAQRASYFCPQCQR